LKYHEKIKIPQNTQLAYPGFVRQLPEEAQNNAVVNQNRRSGPGGMI
jgi:hypothetical protein